MVQLNGPPIIPYNHSSRTATADMKKDSAGPAVMAHVKSDKCMMKKGVHKQRSKTCHQVCCSMQKCALCITVCARVSRNVLCFRPKPCDPPTCP